MGAWGTGLYQNDMAEDVKPLIGQLLSLPIPLDEVLRHVLAEAEGDAGDSMDLVLIAADQFEKRGQHDAALFGQALDLIEGGADIARLRDLDMSEHDLRARQKGLDALAARLRAPRPAKPRKTLTKPKPMAVARGDVIAFVVDQDGRAINPYFSAALLVKSGFVASGWRVLQVMETGFAFDYLPWIAVRLSAARYPQRPELADVDLVQFSPSLQFGTLSPGHFKKMQMHRLGRQEVPVDQDALMRNQPLARSVAVSDISISNALWIADLGVS